MKTVQSVLIRFVGQNTKYEKRDGTYASNITLEDFVEWDEMSYRDLNTHLNVTIKNGYIFQDDHPLKKMRILTLTAKGVEYFEADMDGLPNPPLQDIEISRKVERVKVTSRTNWVQLEMKDGNKKFLPEKLVTKKLLEPALWATFTRNEFMDQDFLFYEVDTKVDTKLHPNKEKMQMYLNEYYGED
ncbi:MAG: hypothetical protein KUG64_10710 [Cycloclasticus sp.]|nr:hypothetical protein [Cycloclasticus sp.]